MAFNSSGRRDDTSLKLRARNIQNAREQTRDLEEENRQMEQRLFDLKQAMTREKEERENKGGGFWKKGQQGNLGNYAKEVLTKPHSPEKPKGQKTRKIKILQDEPIVPVQRKKPVVAVSQSANKIKGPKCGQCEQRAAQVTCVECGEEYCAGCFASFHMKGALKKHRSMPVGSANTPRPVLTPRQAPQPTAPSVQRDRNIEDFTEKRLVPMSQYENGDSVKKHELPISGPSLFDGDYDEGESAASFQDALKAWRSGNAANTQNETPGQTVQKRRQLASPDSETEVSSTEHGTSTQGGDLSQPAVEIHFNEHSVSYAEKLLLKKHRRTDVGSLSDVDSTHCSLNISNGLQSLSSARSDDGEDLVISPEERIDFQSLYRAVNPHFNDQHQAYSQLAIEEVDNRTTRLRGLEETSAYQVEEEPDPEIQQSTSKTAKTKGKRSKSMIKAQKNDQTNISSAKTDRKSSLTSKQHSDKRNISRVEMTEVETFKPPNSRQGSAARSVGAFRSGKSTPTVDLPRGSSNQRNQERDQTVKTPSTKNSVKSKNEDRWATPTKGKKPDARAKSRSEWSVSARSRPASRAKSRSASRASLFGEGVLTKTASSHLQEIARMTPTAPSGAYKTTLADFFIAGVQEAEQEHIITPSVDKRINVSQQKWKVSNRLYQMAPRSWRPDSSLGMNLPVDEVKVDTDLTVEELLSRPSTATIQQQNTQPDIETINFSLSSLLEQQKSKDLQRSMREPSLSRSKNAQLVRNSTNTSRNMPQPAVSSSRPPTASGRESRMIVVDGDDMSRYDFKEEMLTQSHEDEEALQQLEWELASHTGMLDEDGKISRISVLTPEFDDENDSHGSPVNQDVDEGIDIDGQLGEEDLNYNFVDEDCDLQEEVHALK